MIRSWLVELMRDALAEHADLEEPSTYVEDTGEVKWVLEWALRRDIPSPVIADSQQALMSYRDLDWPAAKAVALLRHGYGGHPVHHADEGLVRSCRHPQRRRDGRAALARRRAPGRVHPRAGMLGWSLCHRRREVVAHPVPLTAYVETGEPTGIALLHPWANRLASPEYEIAGRRVRLDTSAPNVHTRERWILELPVTSRMVLDERMLPTGRSEPVRFAPAPPGDRAFDDAFDAFPAGAEFAIAAAGRRVAARFGGGYRFAQVYAPPGAQFISFEPMTAPIDPFASDRTLLAEPGSSYRARFEIVVT